MRKATPIASQNGKPLERKTFSPHTLVDISLWASSLTQGATSKPDEDLKNAKHEKSESKNGKIIKPKIIHLRSATFLPRRNPKNPANIISFSHKKTRNQSL